MNWISLLARLSLAGVFLVAAVSKLTDRRGARTALAEFGVPDRLTAPIASALPLAELAIAGLLVLGATARWGAMAALTLLGLFIVGIAINLARGRRPTCHCFGQLHSAPVGWSTVARNGVLLAIAAVVLWRGRENAVVSFIPFGATPGTAAWIALLVALIALAFAAAEGWLLLELLPQQGRLLVRLESIEAALGMGSDAGLPVGEAAPAFELPDVVGEPRSLAALRSSGHPVLLIFTNPDCAPCDAILPDVARWQREYADRVVVAVISRGSMEVNRGKAERHDLRTVLVQKGREVSEAYAIDSTPSAVLVSADGRIASRIGYGAEAMEGLLRQGADGSQAAHAQPAERTGASNGHPRSEPPALAVGQPVPPLVLPDLQGTLTDLADLRGTPTLLLFWSPSCSFCQGMLPELKAWERKRSSSSPRPLVVSSGTAEANRAMALASPIVLDSDGSVMRRFGASGTPMGLLVDAGGRVASPMAVGAHGVMALAMASRHATARR